MSDEEFCASSSDEGNEEKTSYPSECAIDKWNKRETKRSERKKKLTQGHFTLQLVSPCQ